MESSFSERLCRACDSSPTLREYLFHKQILPTTLCRIAIEAIGGKFPGRLRSDAVDFQSVGRVKGKSATVAVYFLNPPPKATLFRSLIDAPLVNGRPEHYTILVRNSPNPNDRRSNRWFLLAHEIGHLLLHQHVLRTPFDSRSTALNALADREADLFARLAFWPVIPLFGGGSSGTPPFQLKRESVSRALVRYHFDSFSYFDFREPTETPNHPKPEKICRIFVNSLRMLAPEIHRFMFTGERFFGHDLNGE